MKVLAYTESYASETITFIVNELNDVQHHHELLLVYSQRLNPKIGKLNQMFEIPYKFNRLTNKLRWWLEQWQIYYTLYNFSFKRKLNKTITNFKPDIIHCHFGTDFLKFYANLNLKNKNIPILISIYGYDATERLQNRAVLKKCQIYMNHKNVYSAAVSRSLAKYMNDLVKPANSCGLLHSGIDTDFFTRKNNELYDEEFVFLQVSSFHQRKGHKFTLEAFSRFVRENKKYRYRFIIVGFGPLEQEIKEQIRALDLQDHVEMRGPVTPQEMVELASKVNCFVQMSIVSDNGEEEGLPNVLLEAMALELPILSTWHAGIPEIVEHGKNGLLCEEKNIVEYVAAFNSIIEWKPMIENRKKIIDLFSIKSHMNKLYCLYDDIVHSSKLVN